MTQEQLIMAALPWLTVVVVFVGMVVLCIRVFNVLVQIVGMFAGKPVAPPAVQAPAPAPVAPTAPVAPSWADVLAKLGQAAPKPASLPAVPAKPPVPAAAPGEPLWYSLGLRDVGFHEVGDNRGIETFIAQAHVGQLGDPWCAIWANAKLEQAGVAGTRSASSQSFTSSPLFVQIEKPTLGCIVVYWRGSKSSGLGHVGFYVDETATSIRTLGGNESDGVNIEPLPKSSANFGLVGFYWPKAVALPGTGAVTTPAGSLAHVTAPAAPDPPAPGTTITGRMSVFGGPDDKGVAADEGLALCEPSEVGKFDGCFLPAQPAGTTGLARRLDPNSHYIACRWDYKKTSRSHLQGISVIVSANGKTLAARPIDWGPAEKTGRICDMSPGLAAALGLKTDDICTVSIPLATPAVT